MIAYKDIRDVHLEISTLCNATCPLCPRNFRGYSYNDGYPEVNLSLDNAQHIFTPSFLKQLTTLRINGNYGDIVMNPEATDIVEYFRQHNSDLTIRITTNGSARNSVFWQRLAHARASVIFDLDGLEDTHHLYRQNTSWSAVIKNAGIFISAGGYATWKMIKFEHNKHQIDECKALSKELGFSRFEIVDHGRNSGPVFNKRGELTHVLGDYTGEKDFNVLFFKKRTDDVLLEDILPYRKLKTCITCKTKILKSIYISATGDVSPCCWTGFFPKTYGHGEYHQVVNKQLSPMISNNNALEYPLEQCIEWFSLIENRWKETNYESGRLVVCDDNCGC